MKPTLAAAAFVLAANPALAQDAFGTDDDAAYAAELWQIVMELRLAGDGMLRSFPYPGTDPHGMMLDTFFTTATIGGHTGDLVIKRNFGPEGVTVDQVIGDPAGHLDAITLMFRREEGYDPDNQNWFWAKYDPDGSLDMNPAGMRLAGRVAKGAEMGCIACHSSQDDYLFTTDALMMMN